MRNVYKHFGIAALIAAIICLTACNNGSTTVFTVIVKQAERFSITFAQITDAASYIEGPIIYLLGGREGKPTSAEIAVDNPDLYDSDSIEWHVNGNITTGDSITLHSSDYDRIGEYFITVEVRKDGIPYNKTVTFTVAP